MAAEGETVWDQEAHSRALLLKRRCGRCAERVPASALLRAAACPHCGERLGWPAAEDAASLIAALNARWAKRRWPVYGLVAASTAVTGFLPLLPTLVSIAFLLYIRLAILREPVGWFSPARRVLSRLALKLWFLAIGCLNLALVSLVALVPFANVVLSGLVSLATTALFVEVALDYLRGRLRREAEAGPALDAWEWGLPVGLLVGSVVTAGAAAWGIYQAWTVVTACLAR